MKKKPNQTKKKKTKARKKVKVSESELLEVIEVISKKLAYKFKFGYHEHEDMKQQITVFALEGVKNYDGVRPLENFLWTHVRNRLFNYKRDNYQRPNKPCLTCPLYDAHCKVSVSQCSKYNNKADCDLYASWSKRNDAKKNLMYLTGVEDFSLIHQTHSKGTLGDSVANKEILDILDRELGGEEREIYLKFRGGSKVNKSDMLKLTNKIREILGNSYG
jgi:DNA-directed RNA polymerase specialized sigma24 family protein